MVYCVSAIGERITVHGGVRYRVFGVWLHNSAYLVTLFGDQHWIVDVFDSKVAIVGM